VIQTPLDPGDHPPVRVSHLGAISAVVLACGIPILGPVRDDRGRSVAGPVRLRVEDLVIEDATAPAPYPDAEHAGPLGRVVRPGELEATVEIDGRARGTIPLVVLPPHHFSHEPAARITAAAYVRPRSLEVDDLVVRARIRAAGRGVSEGLERGRARDGRPAVRRALDAVLGVLREDETIRYVRPDVQESGRHRVTHQPIRSAGELLAGGARGGTGSCLDLSLLVAAALEHLGHEPVLVFTGELDTRPDHALVGAWTGSHPSFVPILTDRDAILGDVAGGRLVVVEATSVCPDPDHHARLDEAIDRARTRLEQSPALHGIDVGACRPPQGEVRSFEPAWAPVVLLARHEAERFRAAKGLARLETTLILAGLCGAAGPVTTELLGAVGTSPAAAMRALHRKVPRRDATVRTSPTGGHDQVWASAETRARKEGRSEVRESDLLWEVLRSDSRLLHGFLCEEVSPADELLEHLHRRFPPPDESKAW